MTSNSNSFHDMERILWTQIDSAMDLSEQREGGKGKPQVYQNAMESLKVIALMKIADGIAQLNKNIGGKL